MQVSSGCWVGVRIGLYSGRLKPKIRPIRPGAGEYQGLGQLATGCRGAGWFVTNQAALSISRCA